MSVVTEPTAMRAARLEEATAFLRALYGDGDGLIGHLIRWTLINKQSEWWPANQLEQFAEASITAAERTDVYFSIALQDQDVRLAERIEEERLTAALEKRNPKTITLESIRGSANSALAIPGVWAEVDWTDPVHTAAALPPTRDDALRVVHDFELPPSVVIDSGHGLQAWWLFPEPWVFDTPNERSDAQDLIYRFQQTIRAKAAQYGWTVDSTHDLARILRLPGTWNHKRDPVVPVEIVSFDIDRRYSPDDFDRYLVDVDAAALVSSGNPTMPDPVRPNNLSDEQIIKKAQEAPGSKFSLLWNGDWQRIKRAGALAYKSQSDADFALLGILRYWTGGDAEKMDRLFRQSELMRDKWDQRHFSGGRTYGEGSIRRSLQGSFEVYAPPPRLIIDTVLHEVEAAHVNGTNGHGSNGHSVAAPPPPVDPPNEQIDVAQAEPPSRKWSDLWNGEQFVARYGDELRYCSENGWNHYERGAWREDRTGVAMRLAKRMVRQMLRDAAKLEDDDEAKGLASWAIKCHAASKLESILKVAQTEKRVAITITEFDKDPVLLNVLNGTVDLRTGALQPHRPTDLLSKQCPIEYDPTARCDRWLTFLGEVFDNNQAVIDYIQRVAGFSATGLQIYHLLVFLWGAGRNGKTTMLETIAKVLGDYAKSLSSEVLLMSRENSDYNAAQLHGVRLAITSETGQYRRLDEARVKQLTGGDTVPARHPYGRPFRFTPTHHLWTMSNHKPQIEGMDHGIWSRVKLIEFSNRFELPPEGVDPKTWQPGPHIRLADPTLPAQLEAERSGILNWIVQGAVAALRDGLHEPESVSRATETYREQMDVLGGFLDECCDTGQWLSDTSKRLYSAYKSWCSSNGVEPVAINKFGMLLSDRGSFIAVKPTTGDRQRRWSGLQVRTSVADD